LIISKEKIKEKSGKRKELGRHVLHGFYVCNPSPLIRKKKGGKERTPKEKGGMSKNNCN